MDALAVRVRAYAKVNLSLDVLARRPDGYHELRSVIHSISLHDTLTLYLSGLPEAPAGDRGSVSAVLPSVAKIAEPSSCEDQDNREGGSLCLHSAGQPPEPSSVAERDNGGGGTPNLPPAAQLAGSYDRLVQSTSDYSLIDGAIRGVGDATGFSGRIEYRLEKRIPVAAGLGGGSADAAAAMRAACRLIASSRRNGHGLAPGVAGAVSAGAGLGIDLHLIAASLGSDVPFFLTAGTALVEGRGERVTPLTDAAQGWFLLAGNNVPVSTTSVFGAFLTSDRGDGHATERALRGIAEGRLRYGGNDLTAAAVRLSPDIQSVFERLRQVAPHDRVAMSGSGGTVMALFQDEVSARNAHQLLEGQLPWLFLARSIGREEAMREHPAASDPNSVAPRR